ncbi:hypothetical protein PVK06_043634 [Gossypium arboreum]|uniref:Uncharacterized protein n=1 Tax=Gossypium arboreum TaxID=29729 RepID=A0ABR0MP52_GOSAR|nr:hypothetical protein PVK06_043634 [Gossypium arboreum]
MIQDTVKVIVRKKKVPLTSKFINDLFNLPDVEKDEYYSTMNNINWDFLQQVLDVVTNSGSQWIIRKLVERVHELNQGEQEEPTEPDTDESTSENKTEANSVTDTKEEESDKELNSPKPAKASENPEPRVEAEEEPVKLSIEPKSATPMLTSVSSSKKSELSILMDMCKFMHNQQQTYWKYAKIRDDSIRHSFKNISNIFAHELPDAIFETWTEDTDNASRDGAEKTKGMSQENKMRDSSLIIYLFLGP